MSGLVANNIFRASGVIAAAAGGLNWDSTILTALTTFTVTVNNPGVGNRYYINGNLQQTLNLLEGFTYKFDQSDSSNSGHPLRFSTTSGGTHSGGSEYTTGVTTSGTPGSSGAYTQIVVAASAPVLYYYCTNHNYMGGTANTVGETVEANRGYWIDTTSTTCTITLPSSPSKGDQIILVDYARTWGTNAITINPGSSNYQGQDNNYTIEYSTSGEVLNIVYSDATKGWIPQDDDEVADAPVEPNQAIMAYGMTDAQVNMSNLVNGSGTISSDTTGVGTARNRLAGVQYGGDKGIIGFGSSASARVGLSNLVSNVGVIASDTAAVGTARSGLAGVEYGTGGTAVFAYGYDTGYNAKRNLVNSSGVIASDTSVAGGTGRNGTQGARYGTGLGIIAYGDTNGGQINVSNLINTSGVVSADVSGVGSTSYGKACAEYGGDKAFFAFGYSAGGSVINIKNLVSNSGTVAANATGVGTARGFPTAVTLGSRQTAVIAYGTTGSNVSISNLVNSSGVVASDTTGVGTARKEMGSTEFG